MQNNESISDDADFKFDEFIEVDYDEPSEDDLQVGSIILYITVGKSGNSYAIRNREQ